MTAPSSLADLLTEIRTTIRLNLPQPPDAGGGGDGDGDDAHPVPPASSPILALYFSSAWCDDSQASHGPVADAFRLQQQKQRQNRPSVDLVYVSSDTSPDEMLGNLEPGWHYIPFDREELRSNVKRRFGICAKKEMETLGITAEQRRGGIPTLILIDVRGQSVLRDDAIPDVMGDTKVDDPLSHWMSLLSENAAGVVETAASESGKEDGGSSKQAAEEAQEDEKDAKKQKVVDENDE